MEYDNQLIAPYTHRSHDGRKAMKTEYLYVLMGESIRTIIM